MRKLLIGVHDKSCSVRAIDYVGRQFAGIDDLEVTLAHVLPNLPAIFWDEGHILSGDEKRDRQKVVDTWLAKQREKIDPVMKAALDGLVRSGFRADRVKMKFISDSTDVADSLLETARDGGFQTIVLGRCGAAEGKILPVGSVTNKLVHKGSGVAVCVVE